MRSSAAPCGPAARRRADAAAADRRERHVGRGRGLGTFIGPALASILLVVTGPAGALVAVVAIDLISVASVARLHVPTVGRRDRARNARAALAGSFRPGHGLSQ